MPPRGNEPVFVISVAARLVEMHPQTLRKYEREGLCVPSRTQGNLRLYSDSDIALLRQVKYLVEECGLNLAGVQMALEMTRRLRDVRSKSDAMADSGITPANDIRARIDQMLRILGQREPRSRG